jgi:hypothetical protein
MWTKCGVDCLNVNVSCTYGEPRVFNSHALSPKLGLRQFYFSSLKFVSFCLYYSFVISLHIQFLDLVTNKLQNEHHSLGEFSLTHPQTKDAQNICNNMAH